MFVDFYKQNKDNKEMQEYARKKLMDNLLATPKFKDDKIIDLEDTDMESLVKIQFTPSLFYTFKYESDGDAVYGLKFKDLIPLVLVMKKSPLKIEGLNFNLLPMDTRAVILNTINKAYGNYYTDKGLKDAMDGKLAINENFATLLIDSKSRMTFLDYLEQKLGVPIMSAYRSYTINHIKSPRMIEYCDYKYIPLLCFEDSIRGQQLDKIQQEVVKHR
jgi:hypothetical protein